MNNLVLLLIAAIIIILLLYGRQQRQESFIGLPSAIGSTDAPANPALINGQPANTAIVNTYNMPAHYTTVGVNGAQVIPYTEPQITAPTVGSELLVPTLDTNGKPAVRIHDQYNLLNDPLFKNVIYYQNDVNSGRIGLDQCLELCSGNCVEYGQTGNAYCFPK